MIKRQGRQTDAGFTLLELLVIITICSLLLSTLGSSLKLELRVRDTLKAYVATTEELAHADRILRLIVKNAVIDGIVPNNAGLSKAGFHGEQAYFNITTRLSSLEYKAYIPTFIHVNVDPTGELVMLSRPVSKMLLHGAAGATRTILAHGLGRIEINYYVADAQGVFSWQTSALGPETPESIHIRVFLKSNEALVWPDIYIAPYAASF